MNLTRLFNILFFVSLLTTFNLFSLERIETNQIITDNRDYSLSYYQNETAISHWYGSDTWAVKFVAKDFAANTDTLVALTPLTITAVNIYFPTIPDSPINVRGLTYTDNSQYDPLFGENIAELNILNQTITEAGWQQFPLTSPYSGKGMWVVVDNVTNFSNNFMATAAGSGKKSYYKVIEGGDVSFSNLYGLNIKQELLFNLEGHLNIENDANRAAINKIMIEYSHDDLWTYNYSIRNYSDQLITAADLEIKISHPNPEVYDTTYTHLTLDLPPQADTNSYGGEPYFIQLPLLDSQYKISSSLRMNPESVAVSKKTNLVYNFQADSDSAIIMNFISGNHQITEGVLATQRNIQQANWFILNYGVDGSDQLFYSDYAYDYYLNLGVNLTPLTLINGKKYFNSFNISAIEENIENNIYYIPKVFDTVSESLEEEGSSLTYRTDFNYGDRFVFSSFTDNLTMDVFITQKTKHYSDAGDEFIVNDINDVTYNFQRLNEEGNAFFEFTYDIDSVDTLATASNGEKFANVIIYDEETNEIISFSRYPLNNNILVSNQENEENEVTSLSNFSLYPNPVKSGKTLHILNKGKSRADYFTLYNLRGQKVERFINHDDTLKLPQHLASGVYFLQASASKGKKGHLVKLLIIKE